MNSSKITCTSSVFFWECKNFAARTNPFDARCIKRSTCSHPPQFIINLEDRRIFYELFTRQKFYFRGVSAFYACSLRQCTNRRGNARKREIRTAGAGGLQGERLCEVSGRHQARRRFASCSRAGALQSGGGLRAQ